MGLGKAIKRIFATPKKVEGTNDTKVLKDEDIIAENVKQLKVAEVKLNFNPEHAAKVKELMESYKYVSPKKDATTIHADKKIGDRIGDLIVAISKAEKTKSFSDVNENIQKIKVLMAER